MKLSLGQALKVTGRLLLGSAAVPACHPAPITEKAPEQSVVLRGETAHALLKASGMFRDGEDACKGNDPFPDVSLSSKFCSDSPEVCQAICRGKTSNVLCGHGKGSPYEGQFRPEDPVNRAESATMAFRIDGEPPVSDENYVDVPKDAWFAKPAAHAKEKSLFPGEKLEPAKLLTQEDLTRMIRR